MNGTQAGDQEIAQEAYRLWEQDGRPEGRDQEYWFRAKENLNKSQPPTGRTGSARSAGAISGVSDAQASSASPKRAASGKKTASRQNA